MMDHAVNPQCILSNPETNQKIQPSEVARKTSQVRKTFDKLVRCQTRTELLRKLQRRRVGTPEIENFLRKLYKQQGEHLVEGLKIDKSIGRDRIIKLILESKVRNAEKAEREAKTGYWRARGRLRKELGADRKRENTRIVKEVRVEGASKIGKIREKNEAKVCHLESKFREKSQGGLDRILQRYKDIKIFTGGEADDKQKDKVIKVADNCPNDNKEDRLSDPDLVDKDPSQVSTTVPPKPDSDTKGEDRLLDPNKDQVSTTMPLLQPDYDTIQEEDRLLIPLGFVHTTVPLPNDIDNTQGDCDCDTNTNTTTKHKIQKKYIPK